MSVIPDPSVSQHIALTDTAVVPGTPLTLQPPGVTVSTVEKPDVIGLAITAVEADDNVAWIAYGTLELSDWTAIIGSPTLTPGVYYYLGIDHFLTATPPFAGQLVEIGRAESETVFDINIKTAIFLSNVNFFTVFDTLTLLSAASGILEVIVSSSDTLTIADVTLSIDDVIGGGSDLLTISDAGSSILEAIRSVSEPLTIVDTASGVDQVFGDSSDLLVVIDTGVSVLEAIRSVSDSLTITDAALGVDVAP
jgi:hypothetical protein